MRIWRRHHFIHIIRQDPGNQLALIRLPWNNRLIATKIGQCTFASIQPKICFALFFIRPVACITAIRKNRAYIPIKRWNIRCAHAAETNNRDIALPKIRFPVSAKLEAKTVKKMNRLFIVIPFVVVSTGQAKRE